MQETTLCLLPTSCMETLQRDQEDGALMPPHQWDQGVVPAVLLRLFGAGWRSDMRGALTLPSSPGTPAGS